MIRKPAVAGQFYPFNKKELEQEIEKNLKVTGEKSKAAIAPHAGYDYSGAVASYSYKSIPSNVKTIFILGPNHMGLGEEISIDKNTWQTPLGKIKVDLEKAEKLGLSFDSNESEHSIEVHLPFLQYLFKDFKIVPICFLNQSKEKAIEIGKKLAKVVGKDDFVLVSSDFSHYIPYEEAYKQDLEAIKYITSLDINKLYEKVEQGLSACGYGPIIALMQFAKEKNLIGKLLKYSTSGDVKKMNEVVGYASIIFKWFKWMN